MDDFCSEINNFLNNDTQKKNVEKEKILEKNIVYKKNMNNANIDNYIDKEYTNKINLNTIDVQENIEKLYYNNIDYNNYNGFNIESYVDFFYK